jgi:hypothetical protein
MDVLADAERVDNNIKLVRIEKTKNVFTIRAPRSFMKGVKDIRAVSGES